MSEARHTPWAVEHDGGTAEEFGSVYVRAASGDTVCQVLGQIDDPLDSGITEAEQLAHARLIAAAPDLLASLEGVLRVADRATDEFDAARAAIRKATTGQ